MTFRNNVIQHYSVCAYLWSIPSTGCSFHKFRVAPCPRRRASPFDSECIPGGRFRYRVEMSDNTPRRAAQSNDPASERPTKRQKIAVACDTCRLRKIKCDGVRPGEL